MVLLGLVLFTVSASAQKFKSVTQLENNYYSTHQTPNVVQTEINLSIQKRELGHSKLSKSVFGFLPWWEYKAGTYKTIRYNLLSHISIFSFEADSLGNLKNPIDWPWNDLINTADSSGVKLIVTITNFDTKSVHKILTDTVVTNQLFENIRKVLLPYGISGITIDFENISDADLQFAVANFLSALRDYLVRINPSVGHEISFASPAVGFGKWNFSALAEKCDYLFIMGYDFYGSWSSTTGPSSPITGTYYNLTKSLLEDYGSVVSSNSGKLILGVPYFGNWWKTNSQNPYATVTKYDSTKRNNNWQEFVYYRNLFPAYNQKEKLRDNISQTPWLRWQDTTWNQIWYDDSTSLAAKYDLVIQKNLKGIGIWALGYDNGRNELWNLISNKFGNPSSVQRTKQSIPVNLILNQNYPNPFNPSTVISWQIAVGGYTTLKVYDLLGRQIATLLNEYKQAGQYSKTFDGRLLPSGIYFYRLTVGNFMETKKMSLLK